MTPQKYHVLIVTADKEIALELIKKLPASLACDLAYSLEQAVECVKSKAPDLVVAEIGMQVLEKLKPLCPNTLFILTCHKNEIANTYELVQKGDIFDYFVTKPFYLDSNRLFISIKVAIEFLDSKSRTKKILQTFSQKVVEIQEIVKEYIDFSLQENPMPEALEFKKGISQILNYFQRRLGPISSAQESTEEKKSVLILVVDDSEFFVAKLGGHLIHKGYSVLKCTDAEEAIQVAKMKQPNLILLDLTMPGIGGMEVIKSLKTHLLTTHIPILVVSAMASDKILKEVQVLGVSGYLKKPVDLNKLEGYVQKLV